MPKLKQETIEQNKRLILDAAERCFAKQGFHKTNMRDIAAEAELSPGNLYRYFASKDELIISFIEYSFSEMTESLAEIKCNSRIRSNLNHWFVGYIEEMANKQVASLEMEIAAEALQNQDVMDIIHTMGNQTLAQLSKLLEQAHNKGVLSLQLEPKLVAQTVFSILDGAATSVLFSADYPLKRACKEAKQAISLLIQTP